MIKPMRQMVLIDMGKPRAGWESEIIVAPDRYTKINAIGKIVGVGPKCRIISKADIGKEVMVDAIKDEDARFHPRDSKGYGLPEHWHFLAHESRLKLMIWESKE